MASAEECEGVSFPSDLGEEFVIDYKRLSSHDLLLKYLWKDQPTKEDVVLYLKTSNQLTLSIDTNTDYPQVCYLVEENGKFCVFSLFRGNRDEEIQYDSLEDAALQKFGLILEAIYNSQK